MGQKGISTIIASILILVLTITLVAMAWGFISGVFTARTSGVFTIVEANGGNITINNYGTTPISSMTASVDGQPVLVQFLNGPIQPGNIGIVTLQGLPATKQKHDLTLMGLNAVSSISWEYKPIGIYDMDGEGFPGSWGSYSSNALYNWISGAGYPISKISSDQLYGGSLNNLFDILIISSGEYYPASGKSHGSAGDIWSNIETYLKNGGSLFIIGAYPFYYPCYYSGGWQCASCCDWNQPTFCKQAGGPWYCGGDALCRLELITRSNADGVGWNIRKTSYGSTNFVNSVDNANNMGDQRALAKGTGCSIPWENTNQWNPVYEAQNPSDSLWYNDTELVVYSGTYNGKLLKTIGGTPDQVDTLGGRNFILDGIRVLLG